MKIENRPKAVYKYHKINEHLLSLISQNQLWFSHQLALNDPYDCRYSFSDSYLSSLFTKATTTLLKDLQDLNPFFKDINQEKFLEIMLPTLKSEKWMNNFYDLQFGEMLGWCLCCFTTEAENELMWAHYADSNKGVCLEFNLSHTPELYEKLFPVKYSDDYPEINSTDEIVDALFVKRNAWSTEKEWRILSNTKGGKIFSKKSLTGIYFGCNAKASDVEMVKNLLVENNYNNVALKQFKFAGKGIVMTDI